MEIWKYWELKLAVGGIHFDWLYKAVGLCRGGRDGSGGEAIAENIPATTRVVTSTFCHVSLEPDQRFSSFPSSLIFSCTAVVKFIGQRPRRVPWP
jgi:hypothetical protein